MCQCVSLVTGLWPLHVCMRAVRACRFLLRVKREKPAFPREGSLSEASQGKRVRVRIEEFLQGTKLDLKPGPDKFAPFFLHIRRSGGCIRDWSSACALRPIILPWPHGALLRSALDLCAALDGSHTPSARSDLPTGRTGMTTQGFSAGFGRYGAAVDGGVQSTGLNDEGRCLRRCLAGATKKVTTRSESPLRIFTLG